ncbi:MAG: transposase [Akkermansiaceae bacterium]|nr:transposase [Akkermansiaceae bacterium]
MNTKPRKRYTTEFKAQAVELIRTGKPVSQIAEELCIGSNPLYQWKLDSHPATRKLPPQTGE